MVAVCYSHRLESYPQRHLLGKRFCGGPQEVLEVMTEIAGPLIVLNSNYALAIESAVNNSLLIKPPLLLIDEIRMQDLVFHPQYDSISNDSLSANS